MDDESLEKVFAEELLNDGRLRDDVANRLITLAPSIEDPETLEGLVGYLLEVGREKDIECAVDILKILASNPNFRSFINLNCLIPFIQSPSTRVSLLVCQAIFQLAKDQSDLFGEYIIRNIVNEIKSMFRFGSYCQKTNAVILIQALICINPGALSLFSVDEGIIEIFHEISENEDLGSIDFPQDFDESRIIEGEER